MTVNRFFSSDLVCDGEIWDGMGLTSASACLSACLPLSASASASPFWRFCGSQHAQMKGMPKNKSEGLKVKDRKMMLYIIFYSYFLSAIVGAV